MKTKILLSLVFIASLISCGQKETSQTTDNNTTTSEQVELLATSSYNLNSPDETHKLPEILNEVSGLTYIDENHVACVQDEDGLIFIYNLADKTIDYTHKFDSIGDFEGLTYADQSIFVLRSDGRLTEWEDFTPESGGKKINNTFLSLLTANNEGLCFDKNNNRLLIAAKSKPINHDFETERLIYEYDLKNDAFNSTPTYSLSTTKLKEIAAKYNIVKNDTTAKGKVKPFNFRPSSLAVHPTTNDIYIISAADFLYIIMNQNGQVKYIEELDPSTYPKAEGITFLDDETMIITNETAGEAATLLVFRPTENQNN